MPGPFTDLLDFASASPVMLLVLVCWGLCAVGAGFLFSMPLVGAVVPNIWIAVMGEQLMAKSKGRQPDTDMGLD